MTIGAVGVSLAVVGAVLGGCDQLGGGGGKNTPTPPPPSDAIPEAPGPDNTNTTLPPQEGVPPQPPSPIEPGQPTDKPE